MDAATNRTAELAFGITMFALRGIIQNYVIAKDFATPFQDGRHGMTGKSALWIVINLTLEWGTETTDEGSAQSEFAFLRD